MASKKATRPAVKAHKTSKTPKTKAKAKATGKSVVRAANKTKSNVTVMTAPKNSKVQKTKKKTPIPEGHTHPFWRLLEAKKQARKGHVENPHQVDRDHQKRIDDRQAAKVARFMGPRRRAA